MNDTMLVGALMVAAARGVCVLAWLGVYAGVVWGAARLASSQWHPDGGKYDDAE